MNEFVSEIFSKCLDSSLEPPSEEHFVGLYMVPTATVSVPAVTEYKTAHFNLGSETVDGRIEITDDPKKPYGERLSPADLDNHVKWRGVVAMQFIEFRTRSQGPTST